MPELYTQPEFLQGQWVNSADFCSTLQKKKPAAEGFTLEEVDSTPAQTRLIDLQHSWNRPENVTVQRSPESVVLTETGNQMTRALVIWADQMMNRLVIWSDEL